MTIPLPWLPHRLLTTRSALDWAHGRAVVERAASLGVEVVELRSDRLTLALPGDPRRAYADAKRTLALTVAPPSKRRLQPIAPSADWRIDLAEGCPAHCSYCYLAGSLAALIDYVGAWDADVQLRFATKFAAVDPLLGLGHRGKTRMRASINPPRFARFEGGTSPVAARLAGLRRAALAGYKVGLTIAPIIAADGWERAYGELLADAAAALADLPNLDLPDLDLTVELITHRFTPGSKAVLDRWYPGSALEMDPTTRTEKRTKFGSIKHVYPPEVMKALRSFFEREVAATLPTARILYWT